ncbi:MAG: undecaprenyl-phosphate glucose phosphotransferase [Deltaproteobacteria bacterium]|jgi:Undecaprenyl-phosphate glucose phosphotransferase|nr:undecaprenyl-phosphate glucose phosphotransferase [Deltaproteobacteria bacterium]MBW2498754.1 undecaprenyl-phosphate glucose phosphotransferase [Deltaproteobacteria bacterium]
MLYRYGEVFRTLLMVADGVLLAGTWMAAYALRFHSGLPTPLGVPPAVEYVYPIAVILPIFLAFFRSHGLYEARRMDSPLGEASAVIRATAVAVLALAAISFFARSYFDSRLTLVFFALLAPTAIIALRSSLRLALRAVRRRGFNLRYVLVVGSGPLAEMVVQRISGRPDAGLRLIGVVADGALGGCVAGAPVIGRYGELKSILRGQRVDQVLIALSRHESGVFEKVAAELEDEVVNVKIVPDLMHGFSLRSTVESLDGLPVIGLQESPLTGWAALAKRSFDLVGSALALAVCAPLLAGVALAIGLTSGRPILYRQRRMGHDGRVFEMLKFRSMRRDAEAAGPGWTRANDPRRTRIGRWLRKRDLDELPQLFNVLRGDMSLVGPRPERPAYIEAFRREVPGYMLRHKVRAGMTGWAQVHGWRGDTSIQERVEHDLYYIQRWSLWLDLRILFMTLFRRRSAARAEVAATAPAELSARGSG